MSAAPAQGRGRQRKLDRKVQLENGKEVFRACSWGSASLLVRLLNLGSKYIYSWFSLVKSVVSKCLIYLGFQCPVATKPQIHMGSYFNMFLSSKINHSPASLQGIVWQFGKKNFHICLRPETQMRRSILHICPLNIQYIWIQEIA